MVHSASGNATWVDYPLTTTQITATTLENIENALDLVRSPPICEVQLTSANTGIGSGDAMIANHFAAIYDPLTMFSTAFSMNRIIVPTAGRYQVQWTWNAANATAGTALAGKVLLNVPNGTSSATAVLNNSLLSGTGTMGNEGLVRINESVHLAANDALAWSVWANATYDMPLTMFTGVRTKIIVRYVGPT